MENADTYTITNVSRESSGQYKCSLIDDPTMEASEDITVKCKGTRQNRNHSFATVISLLFGILFLNMFLVFL